MNKLLIAASCLLAIGCKDLVGGPTLSAGIPDPKSFETPQGAKDFATATAAVFQGAFVNYAMTSGLFTDEIRYTRPPTEYNPGTPASAHFSVDLRLTPENNSSDNVHQSNLTYDRLQSVRAYAEQSLGLLKAYAPDAPRSVFVETYAFRGYATLLLADFFCSGVPLSKLNYGGDFIYAEGSTTPQLYAYAQAQFDTAISLAGDTIDAGHLARIGRGRVLLALGQYEQAALAVADIPTGYKYQYNVNWKQGYSTTTTPNPPFISDYSVANKEGGNGEPFVTQKDPRVTIDSTLIGDKKYLPKKYSSATILPIVVASGVEARLIRAEAEFRKQQYSAMIETLNGLRRTAVSPAMSDTTDPGDNVSRLRLLLHERANWLFLTGHRQGDLRRIVRSGMLKQEELYPTGLYPGGFLNFGSDVTVPVPGTERMNPLFQECFNRDA